MSKKMEFIKKKFDTTRAMPGKWYTTSYKYTWDLGLFKPCLEKLKEKKLIGLQCLGCNTVSFPPRIVCGKCLRKPEKWVQLKETGKVCTFNNNFYTDKDGKTVSKPIIEVRLDGADTMFSVELNPKIKFEEVYIGMPVKVHWADETKGGFGDIAYFDLDEDTTKDMPLRKD